MLFHSKFYFENQMWYARKSIYHGCMVWIEKSVTRTLADLSWLEAYAKFHWLPAECAYLLLSVMDTTLIILDVFY